MAKRAEMKDRQLAFTPTQLGSNMSPTQTSDDVRPNLHFAFVDEDQEPTESFYSSQENSACLEISMLLSFLRRNRLCASKLRALNRSSHFRR